MIKKSLYEAPVVRVRVIHYEESFLQSTPPGVPGSDDDYDDQGEF